MSVTHPSPSKLEALRARWEGQEERLRAIAESMLAGEDWTVHLGGLPMIDEVPPLDGECLGRDLRGADLRRYLAPRIEIREATEQQAALIAGVTLEAMRNNTPLPGVSPFPAEIESAVEIGVAIRRGETFLVARHGGFMVGVVRLAERREFSDYTGRRPYIEISGLAVLADYRRMGIGSKLLDAAEAAARTKGFSHVVLRTTLEVGLVPYYERHGYEQHLVRQLTYPGAPTFLDVVLCKCMVAGNGAATGRRKMTLRHSPIAR